MVAGFYFELLSDASLSLSYPLRPFPFLKGGSCSDHCLTEEMFQQEQVTAFETPALGLRAQMTKPEQRLPPVPVPHPTPHPDDYFVGGAQGSQILSPQAETVNTKSLFSLKLIFKRPVHSLAGPFSRDHLAYPMPALQWQPSPQASRVTAVLSPRTLV